MWLLCNGCNRTRGRYGARLRVERRPAKWATGQKGVPFPPPAAYPHPVMANDLQADLRELVTRRRILVIVGAGVSVSATRDAPAASWTGLLKLGAAFSCEHLPLTPDSPMTCRRFPLSPSEGERAGVRGPRWLWSSGAQTASNGRGVLSRLAAMLFGYSVRGQCRMERRRARWSVRFSTGLCPISAIGPQLRWGWPTPPAFPRVARGSQPWASGRNPFGIQL